MLNTRNFYYILYIIFVHIDLQKFVDLINSLEENVITHRKQGFALEMSNELFLP